MPNPNNHDDAFWLEQAALTQSAAARPGSHAAPSNEESADAIETLAWQIAEGELSDADALAAWQKAASTPGGQDALQAAYAAVERVAATPHGSPHAAWARLTQSRVARA